jgi:hypothetical protein
LGEILKGFKDEKFLKKSLLRSLRILKIWKMLKFVQKTRKDLKFF